MLFVYWQCAWTLVCQMSFAFDKLLWGIYFNSEITPQRYGFQASETGSFNTSRIAPNALRSERAIIKNRSKIKMLRCSEYPAQKQIFFGAKNYHDRTGRENINSWVASTVLRGYILKNDTPKHTDLLEGFAPLRPRLKNERKSDIIERKKMGKSKK